MGYQRGQEGSTKKHLNVNQLHQMENKKNELQSKIEQKKPLWRFIIDFLLGKPLNTQETQIINKILEAQNENRKKNNKKLIMVTCYKKLKCLKIKNEIMSYQCLEIYFWW